LHIWFFADTQAEAKNQKSYFLANAPDNYFKYLPVILSTGVILISNIRQLLLSLA
jgi:hypothetical protein